MLPEPHSVVPDPGTGAQQLPGGSRGPRSQFILGGSFPGTHADPCAVASCPISRLTYETQIRSRLKNPSKVRRAVYW